LGRAMMVVMAGSWEGWFILASVFAWSVKRGEWRVEHEMGSVKRET
jgi:hypothetical protein